MFTSAVAKDQRSENVGDSDKQLARKNEIEVVEVEDDIISVGESDDDELGSPKGVQQEITEKQIQSVLKKLIKNIQARLKVIQVTHLANHAGSS